jgi:hypothetical protein
MDDDGGIILQRWAGGAIICWQRHKRVPKRFGRRALLRHIKNCQTPLMSETSRTTVDMTLPYAVALGRPH